MLSTPTRETVALVSAAHPSCISGASVLALELQRELTGLGFKAPLIVPRHQQRVLDDVEIFECPSVAVPYYKGLRYFCSGLSRRLQSINPDLIHLLTPLPVELKAARLFRRRGIPVVASMLTDFRCFDELVRPSILRPLYAIYCDALDRQVNECSSIIHCLNSRTAARLQRPNGPGCIVIPPGASTYQVEGRQCHSSELRLKLVFLGRLSPEKRVERIFPILRALPSADLCVIGDGPIANCLRDLVAGSGELEQRVSFTGELGHFGAVRVLLSQDLLIAPSNSEQYGLAVLEALNGGLPVVAAKTDATDDLQARWHRLGLLHIIEPWSTDRAVDKIRRMLAGDSKRLRVIHDGDRWSWRSFAGALAEHYLRLLGAVCPGAVGGYPVEAADVVSAKQLRVVRSPLRASSLRGEGSTGPVGF